VQEPVPADPPGPDRAFPPVADPPDPAALDPDGGGTTMIVEQAEPQSNVIEPSRRKERIDASGDAPALAGTAPRPVQAGKRVRARPCWATP
jgi:hypothetical protein